MKKILALMLALCMVVAVCAACGSSISSAVDTQYDYIVDLCEAIEDGDDDEVEAIQDDITEWSKESTQDLYDEMSSMKLDDIQEMIKEMEEAFEDLDERIKELEKEFGEDIVAEAQNKFENAANEGSNQAEMPNFNF